MLARYKIIRGRKPPGYKKPTGTCQDTRYFRNHFLSPSEKIVKKYLSNPSSQAWETFERDYIRKLNVRFEADRAPFDRLAELATNNDEYIGCSCPTKKNPNVYHCHTMLALEFMQEKYSKLQVKFPAIE